MRILLVPGAPQGCAVAASAGVAGSGILVVGAESGSGFAFGLRRAPTRLHVELVTA